jgi:hypothetical protein
MRARAAHIWRRAGMSWEQSRQLFWPDWNTVRYSMGLRQYWAGYRRKMVRSERHKAKALWKSEL